MYICVYVHIHIRDTISKEYLHELERLNGMTKVWNQLMIACHKDHIPVIVHNGLLDLSHLYNTFVCKLDSKSLNNSARYDWIYSYISSHYLDAKEATGKGGKHPDGGWMPPIVIDTKYLCQLLPYPIGNAFHRSDKGDKIRIHTGLKQLFYRFRNNSVPFVTWHTECAALFSAAQTHKDDNNTKFKAAKKAVRAKGAKSAPYAKYTARGDADESKLEQELVMEEEEEGGEDQREYEGNTGGRKTNAQSSTPFHHAGYDAFCTGMVFAKMCGLLTRYNYINQFHLRFDFHSCCLQDIMDVDVDAYFRDSTSEQPSRAVFKPLSNATHPLKTEHYVDFQFWTTLKTLCRQKWDLMKHSHQSLNKDDILNKQRVQFSDPNSLALSRHQLHSTYATFCQKFGLIYFLHPLHSCQQNTLDQILQAMNHINCIETGLKGVRLDMDLDNVESYFRAFVETKVKN
ncbi:hypothetical protein RFI_12562 [Reticulomyxa filosa]|uniref:Uncharacterized protein n=1 Tax=Reticulomyxa filosa TaxID=46433 RepID=X6NFA8_RETFI|nr:hypothetical protein RFI_12562 [Reticulomyxa filosa]|eukprot:ETO24593.1 hypothetical protein RFI_12562 [Reticulomyxa filosa]